MKQIIFSLFFFLIMMVGCSSSSSEQPKPSPTENNSTQLIIDLDKEGKKSEDLRGKETLYIDIPIYIGDNDEVSFIGDTIEKESPIKVKIGDNDEVSFEGDNFTISTSELKHGDIIQMTGKSGHVFVEMQVMK